MSEMKPIMENFRNFQKIVEQEDKTPKYRDDQGRIYKVYKRKPQTGGWAPAKIEAAIKSGQIPPEGAAHWRAKAAGKGGEWQLCGGGTCHRDGVDTDEEFYEFLKTLECITKPNCINESQADSRLQEIFNEMMSPLGVDPSTASESGFSWEIYTGGKGQYFQLNMTPAASDTLFNAGLRVRQALKSMPQKMYPDLFAKSDDTFTASSTAGRGGYWSYKLAPERP